MTQYRSWLLVVVSIFTGLSALTLGAAAKPRDPIQGLMPSEAYGLPLIAYAQVDRPDGTYRRMLTQPETLEAMARTGDIPDGARLLMETYYSPGQVGTVFHAMKVDGQWRYGSFPGVRPNLAVRPQASCLSCHAQASGSDFVFTRPSLRSAAQGGGEARFTCDRSGRRPCDAAVYRAGAGS